MNFKDFLLDKYDYNFKTNEQIITLISSYRTDAPKITLKWISHILNAQEIWNSRILGTEERYSGWQIHPIPEWPSINQRLNKTSCTIIKEVDPDQRIFYRNSAGESFENSCAEILYHIVNHATYHRGQIAYELREKGLTPLSTDYIFFKR